MTPLVSIVIPSFNGVRLIADALRSVQRQTLADWELIVVDDRSTDDTIDVVRSVCPAARIERLEINSGEAIARNVGLAHARGPYVTFLDQDDVVTSDHLEVLLRTRDECGADAVAPFGFDFVRDADRSHVTSSSVPVIDDSSGDLVELVEQLVRRRPAARPEVVSAEAAVRGGVSNTVLAEKELLIAVGGFPPFIRGVGDYLMLCELARRSRLVRSGRATYGRRLHSCSGSTEYSMPENILTARLLLGVGNRAAWDATAWDVDLLAGYFGARDLRMRWWVQAADALAFARLLRMDGRELLGVVRRALRTGMRRGRHA
jgi:glycosyltransferase involved in cell wall biosynthesis